jgi:predicted XRE-type DNA-binding protein
MTHTTDENELVHISFSESALAMSVEEPSVRPATLFRVQLLGIINHEIEVRGWSQKECETHLSMRQARVSELLNRKVDAFSCDKLLDIAGIMGLTITAGVVNAAGELSH